MANRTVKDAHSIKGTNPQYLIEKIIRSRIYDSRYWKEECFALTAELLVDKAMELKYISGVCGGNIKPSPFLCLVLKMLQIQPEKDIIVEFIKNEDFKYVRALGAYYMRLTGSSVECYRYLEPLYNDYRKLKIQSRDGAFTLIHMDEFIDQLLTEERMCDVILPRIQKRFVLVENNDLEPRQSALDDDVGEENEEEDDVIEEGPALPATSAKESHGKPSSPEKKHSESSKRRSDRSPNARRRSRSRSRDRKRSRRSPSQEGRDKKTRRDRSKSPDRRRDRDRQRGETKGGGRDERDREKHRDKNRERDRKEKDRGTSSRDKGGKKDDKLQQEIEEANALRKKLGLPLLKP